MSIRGILNRKSLISGYGYSTSAGCKIVKSSCGDSYGDKSWSIDEG